MQAAGLIRTLEPKRRPTEVARVVFHGKRGELRQGYREGRCYRTPSLRDTSSGDIRTRASYSLSSVEVIAPGV